MSREGWFNKYGNGDKVEVLFNGGWESGTVTGIDVLGSPHAVIVDFYETINGFDCVEVKDPSEIRRSTW